MGSEEKRGKMQVLHSSSALVVNEPYHRHTKRTIKDKYLNVPGLWARLPRCEKLVKHIREEEQGRTSFTCLDVPQLLKHILGLAYAFGPIGFELLYLWYEVPSEEAKNHREELEKLKGYIGDEVTFRSMTYQELFAVIRECHAVDEGYILYLAERYFA